MRIIVFFDLPVLTEENRREYRKFRRNLIKSGYIQVQESVYCRLAQNSVAADTMIESLKKHCPSQGVVQALKVTEKQYSKMDFIVGERKHEILDTDERLVIL